MKATRRAALAAVGLGASTSVAFTVITPPQYTLPDPSFQLISSDPDLFLALSPGIANDVPTAVSELATCAMMLLGFAGLGLASYLALLNAAPAISDVHHRSKDVWRRLPCAALS